MTRLTKTLHKLKSLPLDAFTANLWIVKRTLKNGEAGYSVASVKTDSKLQKKLASIVDSAVQSANHVEDYDFLTADQDSDTALGIAVEETDFHDIAVSINAGSDAEQVENAEELFDSWAYVIDLHDGQDRVMGLRKINEGWKLKQKERIFSALFQNHMLLDYEEAQVFKLDKHVDCLAYNESLFILDKRKFESALNFRQGMEKNRDALFTELRGMDLISGIDLICSAVGNRLGLLRRVSMIKKNGYYQQVEFVQRIREVCTTKGWAVRFDGNKMVATEENVDLILRLLNNDRLGSLLNDEIFDVSAKKKVSNGS